MAAPCPVYRPRKPHLTPLYQCVQDHYEALEQFWPERFEKRYGFWRPYLKEVMVRYLSCGDMHAGFARIRCHACGTERLLAFSCKRRYLCPSCHQKRAVAFGQWVLTHILPAVPYRHFVLSIPKILRRFFLRDRRLLADLSRCGWQALKPLIQTAVPEAESEPGAVVATQSFGDFPERFHPHLHILATDGAFYAKGLFRVASRFPVKELERLFRHKVLRMLLDKGRMSPEIIRIMDRWRHSGFNVYRGPRILPREKKSLERLAAYLIRSSFSQVRMEYLPEKAQVLYHSKDGKEQKTYDALEWLAAMGTHVPARGQQSVRYYGFLSNAARGRRRKEQGEGEEAPLPSVLEPQVPPEGFGKNSAWARLIRKVYEVDPLECPRCSAQMRVISFITDPLVVRRILEHLGLWLANARPVPRAQSPPVPLGPPDSCFSQRPPAGYEKEFNQLPPAEWDF
jgi:hypothetical protein